MADKNKGAKGKHAAQNTSKGAFHSGGSKHAAADKKTDAAGAVKPVSGAAQAPETSAFRSVSPSKTSEWSGSAWKAGSGSAKSFTSGSGKGSATGGSGAGVYGTSAAAYDASAVDAYKHKRDQQKRGKKTLAIVIGAIVAVLAVVYVAGVVFFSSHYLPNSTIGDEDISLQNADSVASSLESKSKSYTMKVTGEGLNFTVDATNSGVNIDADTVAKDALNATSAWAWPVEVFQQHDLSDLLAYAYDESALGKQVKAAVDKVNQNATDPTDATIAYDSATGAFTVQKEKAGTKLDYDAVMKTVTDAVMKMNESVTIGSDCLVQPKVTSTDSRLATAATAANSFLKASLTLTLDGTQVATVDAAQIAKWVTLDSDENPTLDESAVKTWVQDLAGKLDTTGGTRTLTTGNGGTYTVSGGDYGWTIDQDSLYTQIVDAVKQGTSGTLAIPCTSEANAYSATGSDIGDRYVDVNLTTQHAVMYVNGTAVWEADVVTGKPDGEHDTPTGVYYLKNKESPSTLIGQMVSGTNTPEYTTKVSYWMPFVGNYIGFHDATWQSAFGGTRYMDGYGSHGCVNLSLDTAGALYNVIQVGDPVIVHK